MQKCRHLHTVAAKMANYLSTDTAKRGVPVSLTLQKLRNKCSIAASCTVKRQMCGCSIRTQEIQESASNVFKGNAILISGQRFAKGRESISGLPLSGVQPHRRQCVSKTPFFTCPSRRQTQTEPHRHSGAPTSFISWPETRKSHRLKWGWGGIVAKRI